MDDRVPGTSRGGAVLIWFAVVMLLGVLATAASTDSLDVWRTPEPSDQGPLPSPPAGDDTVVPVVRDLPEPGGVNVLGLAVVLLVALMALLLLTTGVRTSPLADFYKRPFRWVRLTGTQQAPLPEVTMHDSGVGIDNDRNALLDGDPRNGVVACWMRLEQTGFDAGLPRWAAETVEEYSLRMLSATSVDSTSLGELAELYREARFSGHRLGEQHRDRASVALDRISDDLAVDEAASP